MIGDAIKADWEQAKVRWRAFWELRNDDRPLIDVRCGRPSDVPWPVAPATLEGLWLDPEYRAAVCRATVAGTYYGGEAVPCGPLILAGWTTGCGPGVQFHENTIYHPVTTASIREPVNWHPGPDDPWRGKLDALMRRLLEQAGGRYYEGYPFQVPVNDLLMLLRGNTAFLTDLADHPELCVRRLREMLPAWVEDLEHFRGLVDAYQVGECVYAWPGLWRDQFVLITQSDMSCMISGELFERYVMVEMDALGERYGTIWYHLDGPGAIRHLPILLSRPYMRCIQYVPGSGQPENGPTWLELYRQVQAAGRGLDLHLPKENVEFLVRHFRPEGVVLRTGVGSIEEADELVHNAAKWCGSHVNQ